jgi:hypothetical protein
MGEGWKTYAEIESFSGVPYRTLRPLLADKTRFESFRGNELVENNLLTRVWYRPIAAKSAAKK